MLKHNLAELEATDDLGNTAAHLAVFHDSPRSVVETQQLVCSNKPRPRPTPHHARKIGHQTFDVAFLLSLLLPE